MKVVKYTDIVYEFLNRFQSARYESFILASAYVSTGLNLN